LSYHVVFVPLDEGERLSKKDRKEGEERKRSLKVKAADQVFELEREHNRSKRQKFQSYFSFKSSFLFSFKSILSSAFFAEPPDKLAGRDIYL